MGTNTNAYQTTVRVEWLRRHVYQTCDYTTRGTTL